MAQMVPHARTRIGRKGSEVAGHDKRQLRRGTAMATALEKWPKALTYGSSGSARRSTRLRRTQRSCGLAGGGDFAVASELGNGGLLGSNGGTVAPLWLRWETEEEQEMEM